MARAILKVPIFYVQITIVYGDYEEIKIINDRYGFSKLKYSTNGRTSWSVDNNLFVMLFVKDNIGSESIGTIVHECKHMVNMIMEARGIELSTSNDEAECYLLEHVFTKVFRWLKKHGYNMNI